MKNRISKATKSYLETCDKKGFPLTKNISKEEKVGIKEMKEDKENIYLCTDKSGKLAAQKRQFYIEAMQTHLGEDKLLTWEEQCSLEKRMTAHTLQWGGY